jgi:hypothetical protein
MESDNRKWLTQHNVTFVLWQVFSVALLFVAYRWWTSKGWNILLKLVLAYHLILQSYWYFYVNSEGVRGAAYMTLLKIARIFYILFYVFWVGLTFYACTVLKCYLDIRDTLTIGTFTVVITTVFAAHLVWTNWLVRRFTQIKEEAQPSQEQGLLIILM